MCERIVFRVPLYAMLESTFNKRWDSIMIKDCNNIMVIKIMMRKNEK